MHGTRTIHCFKLHHASNHNLTALHCRQLHVWTNTFVFGFFFSASFLVAQFNPHATHEPACLSIFSCLCAWGIHLLLRQLVRALSGEVGRSVCLGCAVWFSWYFVFFFSFLSSSVRGNEKDFCCMTAACNVSAASSSCICSCCASLCHLFFSVCLNSNIPAYFHVYILFWMACKIVCIYVFIVGDLFISKMAWKHQCFIGCKSFYQTKLNVFFFKSCSQLLQRTVVSLCGTLLFIFCIAKCFMSL